MWTDLSHSFLFASWYSFHNRVKALRNPPFSCLKISMVWCSVICKYLAKPHWLTTEAASTKGIIWDKFQQGTRVSVPEAKGFLKKCKEEMIKSLKWIQGAPDHSWITKFIVFAESKSQQWNCLYWIIYIKTKAESRKQPDLSDMFSRSSCSSDICFTESSVVVMATQIPGKITLLICFPKVLTFQRWVLWSVNLAVGSTLILNWLF